ncbi:MAG: hypothetical protein CMH46_06195 [Muricauda sp.]|nr:MULTISPECIES: serine hydrolase [unclassified Allomuricauda]MAU15116.1 hypothetical protein [Allomuricauda sp.]|tara:strand:- start:881 stop:2062 length:1182 start_codon:yes stop_codon:yes gene_type:complete
MTQKNRTWDILEKGNGCQDHPLDFSNETTRLGYYIGLSFLLALLCVFGGIAQNQKQETPEVWPTIAWPEANPGAVGMDSTVLKTAERIYPHLFPSGYSLLVIRNGQLVSESYFNGQTAETNNHIYSVTKTFVATLLGVSVKQGWIKGVDERVTDLLPEYPIHPKLADLTLEDVLTHRSGVQNNKEFADIGLLLKAEPKSIPGTTFEYSNYAPSLLTAILGKQAKQGVSGAASDVSSMAQKYLFDPLGIRISEWRKGPNGVPEGGNGLHMTARDMARLGYLLLHNGRWEDKQLLPENWVQEASKYRVDFDRQKGYGYLNWVRRRPDKVNTAQGEQEVHGYFAYGHRGQYIGVYPELDLLVITTADASDPTRDTYFVPDLLHDFVRRFIFSAIME